MIIDCRTCEARGAGCADCAATTLLGAQYLGMDFQGTKCQEPECQEPEYQDLDPAEIRALTVLANAGMIPPLRYAPRLARAC